ncbi:MAG TPA: TonB-dependent receptor [Steroidobacteraceae bacterium]|nr:TonB-dependent receptor [Steroidobacteraceae bacterium]
MHHAQMGGRSALSRRRLAAAIALALPLPAAFAQDTTLDPVMVTAQRRVENIQQVPVSVSTLGDEKLDILASGGDDVRFLSGRVPSLLIESSFGRAFPRFYIRGLGNTDFDLNASQPVSLVYDDVVQENPILKGFPAFDLEQIEVFRGPQGTLFGRNTPAGVVKFNSVRPSREAGGYFQGSYGDDDTANFEGAVGGPVGENWAVRFSGLYQHRGDWVDNARLTAGGGTNVIRQDAFEGYDELAGRLQFLYEASDSFSALVNIHARSLDGTARMFRANIFQPGTNNLVSGFDPETVYFDGRNFQDLDSSGASLRIRWDMDRVTLHSITGYESVDALSRGDIDGGFSCAFAPCAPLSGPGFIPFTAESADGLRNHSQFSQEFRWESREWGAFDWQAGIYYFDEDLTIDSFNYDTVANGIRNGNVVQQQENKSWAVFGSAEYQLSDAFTLRGGLRYTDDEKDFVAQRFQSPIGGGALGPLTANPSDEEFTGDVSLTWALSDDTNVYGRVARGYRAPSIQGRLLFGNTVSVADSETILSWEAGVKTSLLGGRARLGFTAYMYTMDDQQLTAVGGATNFNTLINANQVDGQGFEVDLEAYVTDSLLVTFGASYNDTEIDDSALGVQVCGSGCTFLDPVIAPAIPPFVPATVSIDGNRLPQSPEWIANFTARWGMPLGDGELFVFTDWAYRSDVNFFLYESAEYEGPSLLEGGLRVGYNWNDGAQQVSIFGRNITDEIEAVGGIDFNNLTGFINEPRRWGLAFSTKF